MNVILRRAARASDALALAAVLLTGVAAAVAMWRWTWDDAYILYRMAQNLAAGQGWAFNPGEAHNPSTSVLQTLLLALFALVHVTPRVGAHVIGLVSVCGAGVCAWFVLREETGRMPAAFGGVVTGFVAGYSLTWGLEPHLLIFVVLLAAVLDQRRSEALWPVLGVAVLARPDAVVLLALHLGVRVTTLVHADGVATAARKLRRPLLALAIVLAPWVLFSLVRFGQVLPDTLSNKQWQARSGLWGHGLVYWNDLVAHAKAERPWLRVGYALGGIGLGVAIARRSSLAIPFAFVAIQQAAYVVLNVPGYHWYFLTLDVFAMLAATYALGSAWQALPRFEWLDRTGGVLAAVWLVFLAARWALAAPKGQLTDVKDTSYRQVSEAINAANLPPGNAAAFEVGTYAYWTHRPMLDLVGLATPNPPYIVPDHIDRFYAAPPQLLIFGDPVFGFERPVFDDPRFVPLYQRVLAVPTAFHGYQVFSLRPGARGVAKADLPAYVQKTFPSFAALTPEQAEAARKQSATRRCSLDFADERLVRGPRMVLDRFVLTAGGWAGDVAQASNPDAAAVVLDNGTAAFQATASLVDRPDAAGHIHQPSAPRIGFAAAASLLGVPPGAYEVRIVQTWAGQVQGCATGVTVDLR